MDLLRTLRTGLSVQLISRMRFIRWLQAFFALPAVLSSEVGYTRKMVDKKRLGPNSVIFPVPTTLPMGLSWAMFFCPDVTDHCTLTRTADSPLFVCSDHSAPPLLGSKNGLAFAGVRWSYADNLRRVLARGADCSVPSCML